MNLYQINAEIEQLENAAEDGLLIDAETGELITIEQALDQLRMERMEKIENIALMCKNWRRAIDAIKAEEDALEKRRKALETKLERRKLYLLNTLTRQDGSVSSFFSLRAEISIRNNAPSVVIRNEALLPREFMIQKITAAPDKASLKEVLSRGIEVPGAALERKRSVMIK